MSEPRIGEIIASSTTNLVAECYHDRPPPTLGALVRTAMDGAQIYGIVHLVSNVLLDESRRPIARGENLADEDELWRAHPEFSRLIRTEVEATLVGYQFALDSPIRQGYPPRPARLHGFVYLCGETASKLFVADTLFVDLLVGAIENPRLADQVVTDAVASLAASIDDPDEFKLACGKRLARLFNRDLVRLDSVLLRIAGR